MATRKTYCITIKKSLKTYAEGNSVDDVADLFIKASVYFTDEKYRNLTREDMFIYEML